MDFSEWAKIIFQSDTKSLVRKLNSKFNFHIDILEKSLSVALNLKDKVILEFKDTIIEKGKLNSFIRKVKNQEYILMVT